MVSWLESMQSTHREESGVWIVLNNIPQNPSNFPLPGRVSLLLARRNVSTSRVLGSFPRCIFGKRVLPRFCNILATHSKILIGLCSVLSMCLFVCVAVVFCVCGSTVHPHLGGDLIRLVALHVHPALSKELLPLSVTEIHATTLWYLAFLRSATF